ncbi:hypothetical protein QOT17_015775 [Balamuthia mandrillaris]
MQVEDRANEANQQLDRLAPVVKPLVVPRGLENIAWTLEGLCKSEKQRQALRTFVNKQSKAISACAGCRRSMASASLQFTPHWEVDVKRKQYCLTNLQFLCQECRELKDVPGYMTKALAAEDEAWHKQKEQHWSRVNGPTQQGNTSSHIAAQMQLAYNMAYSLYVIASNIPRETLKLVVAPTGGTQDGQPASLENLPPTADLPALLLPLLPTQKK